MKWLDLLSDKPEFPRHSCQEAAVVWDPQGSVQRFLAQKNQGMNITAMAKQAHSKIQEIANESFKCFSLRYSLLETLI